MIYPTTTLALAQMRPMTALASSSALAVPFLLAPGAGYLFSAAQLSPTQDYSIRFWISVFPGGQFAPTAASFWHLNRVVDQVIAPYDLAATAPSGMHVIAVPLLPGYYNLNILNLVNAENVFSFSASAIDCAN